MARNRRTVSFMPEVDKKLEKDRGKNSLSTFLNDFFKDHYGLSDTSKLKKTKKEKTKTTK